MTNEEAIKILSNHEMIDIMWDKADEALNMAIDALEQQPCEDCISRADVLEIISDINDTVFGQVVSREVEKLPSVQPNAKMEGSE